MSFKSSNLEMMTKSNSIAIIGGGAAGVFAAIAAAEASPSAKIYVFEKSNKLLSKVSISGGGRCNVTHACFDPCLLYTSPSPRDRQKSRMPSSA